MQFLILVIVPQIIEPPDNFHRVTFDESTSSVQLMCSLNIIIPSSVTVIWSYNGNPFLITLPNKVITAGNTTTLLIVNPQPSDAGVYQCIFSGLNLQRVISLGQFHCSVYNMYYSFIVSLI